MSNEYLKNYVPDGDCKKCKVRKNCWVSCMASIRRMDRLIAEEEDIRRRQNREILREIDKNNEVYREGLKVNADG